LNAINEIQ
jgi:hypothetical protein